jgi:predicted amidohydrolase YtcJ
VKQADILFVNGNVITADDRFTRANAVAVRDGRIPAVGGADVRASPLAPAPRSSTSPGGRSVPGFVDTHGHIAPSARDSCVSLAGATSIAEIQERITRAPRRHRPASGS